MKDVGILHICMAIWSKLWLFGIFCVHWVYFTVILYTFSRFGMLY
jgi:hypothetical protein